jgi:predicted ATPase with chaperone activity
VIRERVLKANNIQFKRQAKFNDKLTPDEIEKSIPLSKENNFRPFFVHKNTKNSIKITQDSRR